MSNYKYHSLQNSNETRLLRLEPAAKYNDDLIGSLIHISLTYKTPKYEALSYVWNNSSESWTTEYNWTPPQTISAIYPPTADESEIIPSALGSAKPGHIYPSGDAGEMTCDGQKVVVGSELYDALRRLRLPDRERLIWIDALCINQQDVTERNTQVGNMREIYRKADHVLIWLGEHFSGGPASRNMFSFIEGLENITMNLMLQYGPNDRRGVEREIARCYIMYQVSWNYIKGLLSRAWFGRVWVLQEVVNAKRATLYAGSGQCEWDTIASLARWLSMYDVSSPLNIRATICSLPAVDMIWKLSRLNEDPTKPALPRLLDVLADSRLCLSTFPIDKVYGVLGLVRDEDASKIKIDYGNKPADVYKQIAMMELERIGIEILYYCTNSGEMSIVECPSWVPDWSQPCYHDAFIRLGYKSSAGGSSKASFRVENDVLIIKGRIVDTIQVVELTRKIPTGSEPGKASVLKESESIELSADVTEEVEPQGSPNGYYSVPASEIWEDAEEGEPKVRETSDESREQEEVSEDGDVTIPSPKFEMVETNGNCNAFIPEDSSKIASIQDVNVLPNNEWFPNLMKIAFPNGVMTSEKYEAFWRTCCCNRNVSGKTPGQDFANSFPYWAKAMAGLKLKDFEAFQDNGMDFMESFTKFCNNRRFFRTEKGRLGWGPDQMREGDVVYVVSGGTVPLVLRDIGEREFEVIGDAYVHGIMDGEVMSLGIEEKDLVLV